MKEPQPLDFLKAVETLWGKEGPKYKDYFEHLKACTICQKEFFGYVAHMIDQLMSSSYFEECIIKLTKQIKRHMEFDSP